MIRKLFICAWLCAFHVLVSAENEKLISNSDVREVAVYLNMAKVTRTGSTQLAAGRQLIVFPSLSPYVDAQSLQVSGKGEFSILSARYELNYLAGMAEIPELRKLEDSLEVLQFQLEVLLNRKTVLNEEQSLLLANKTIGGTQTGLNGRELELVADIFRRRLTRVKDELLDVNQKEKKQREKIQKVQNQVNTYRQKKDQPSGSVIIETDARTSTNASFEISYIVSNASWSPFYELRTTESDKEISLVFMAAVRQTTGEDWKSTKVKLTSYNPAAGNYKPELFPWYLRFQLYKSLGILKRAEQAEVPMMEGGKKEKEEDKQAVLMDELVEVSQSDIFNNYDISVPYDVKADGKDVMMQIQKIRLPMVLNYYAVPKLDKDVFVLASVTGWQDLNLLPGKAGIYYDGAYTGETFLNPENASDTLQVPLGRDRSVIIKREMMKDFSSNQLIGSNRTRTFVYELTLKSLKSKPITLWLEDQLPVSQEKDIEVKALELSGADLDKETGKLTWKLELKAGEQIKKRFSYSVKHPKDKPVCGL
jgi:uncharacterized protein (TIGR02231 family)